MKKLLSVFFLFTVSLSAQSYVGNILKILILIVLPIHAKMFGNAIEAQGAMPIELLKRKAISCTLPKGSIHPIGEAMD